jgi:hypothetical protein
MIKNLFNVWLETDKRQYVSYIMNIYHNVYQSEHAL